MKKMVQSQRHKDTRMFLPIMLQELSLKFLFLPSQRFNCTLHLLLYLLLLFTCSTSFSSSNIILISLFCNIKVFLPLSLFYLCNHKYIRSLHLPTCTCTCTCTYAAFCSTSLLFTLSTDDSVHVRTWTGQNAVTMMDEICMLAHVISR